MNRKTVALILFTMIGYCNFLHAQIITVTSGSDLTILAGTPFSADGLILTPSADYTLSNVSLSRTSTVVNTNSSPYIARVYQFSTTMNPFSGTVQINYQPGELNGIVPSTLQLNAHNGTSWNSFVTAVNDGPNNFVLSGALSGQPLSEMTLGVLSALPVSWYSFTANKQSKRALLQWTTGSEKNTLNYTVQQSISGKSWSNIGTVPAAGNSSSTSRYSFVHATPTAGKNFYRILQTDIDGKFSYSEIRPLYFNADEASFSVISNPVSNGSLMVQVNSATVLPLAMFDIDGRLLWKKQLGAGVQTINVSGFTKGTYFLRSEDKTQKIIIQ